MSRWVNVEVDIFQVDECRTAECRMDECLGTARCALRGLVFQLRPPEGNTGLKGSMK